MCLCSMIHDNNNHVHNALCTWLKEQQHNFCYSKPADSLSDYQYKVKEQCNHFIMSAAKTLLDVVLLKTTGVRLLWRDQPARPHRGLRNDSAD